MLFLPDWLDEALMQAIARENNLAETAFAVGRAEGGWELRWFTPTQAVDFCGHATLATAHVLIAHEGQAPPPSFHTRSGVLHVSADPSGYRLDLPRLDPEPLEALPAEIAPQLADGAIAVFRTFENIFVELEGADRVRDFVPDLAAIAGLGPVGLVITARERSGGRADFVSRCFVPGAGIPEDPVTGSIHATLMPYWADWLGRTRLTACQASARGGWLGCELAGSRVMAGGACRHLHEGRDLPSRGRALRRVTGAGRAGVFLPGAFPCGKAQTRSVRPARVGSQAPDAHDHPRPACRGWSGRARTGPCLYSRTAGAGRPRPVRAFPARRNA
ncbi:PhzF family phenazine biosynthesis protein [Rhodovulum sp. YEN HP10]|uniref:PhzF family phenazine biosynthesis protein n=1 Tax=Rhodovulum sp. HP10 TaxID=3387397 RepID=UPI0039E1CB05